MTKVQDRLIVALDFPTGQEARALVEELGDAVTFYKVGMELFYSEGPAIVSYLKEQGKKVFLDLKLQRYLQLLPGASPGRRRPVQAKNPKIHVERSFLLLNR